MDRTLLKQFDEQMQKQADDVETTIAQTGLTYEDLTSQGMLADLGRMWTGASILRAEQQGSAQADVQAKAYDSLKALYQAKGKDQDDLDISLASKPGMFGQVETVEELAKHDEEILRLRSESMLNYNNQPLDGIKTSQEVKDEMIDDYAKLRARDDVETEKSSWVGSVSYGLGAIYGWMQDPINLTTSLGAGTPSLMKVVAEQSTKKAIQAGLQMAGYEIAVNAAQKTAYLPHRLELEKEALGVEYTPMQIAQEYAVESLTVGFLSILGAGGTRAATRSARAAPKVIDPHVRKQEELETQQPVSETAAPDPLQPNEPVTREFADNFYKAKDRMDPDEAAVIQSTIDAAVTTPPGLRQQQHASNYETATKSMARGEEFDVQYKPEESIADELPDDVIDVPIDEAKYKDLIDDTNPIDKVVDEQLYEVKSKLDSLDDSIRVDEVMNDTIIKSETVADIKARLQEKIDDVDTIDKVIACFSKGGPKVNG